MTSLSYCPFHSLTLDDLFPIMSLCRTHVVQILFYPTLAACSKCATFWYCEQCPVWLWKCVRCVPLLQNILQRADEPQLFNCSEHWKWSLFYIFKPSFFWFPVYFSTSQNFTFTVAATVGRLLTPHEIKAATQPNTVEPLAAKALHFWGGDGQIWWFCFLAAENEC